MLFFASRRLACQDEVRLYFGKHSEGFFEPLRRDAEQRLGARRIGEIMDLGQQRTHLVPKVEEPDAPVGGMAPALDQSALGKLVENAHQRDRLDFQITGAGSIDARGIDADEVAATLIGNGAIALAGKAGRARLSSNGSGSIAAIPLSVGDLTVYLDGPGDVQASARFTADMTSTGLGRIVVTGNPKCTAHAVAGGPILCGPGAAP